VPGNHAEASQLLQGPERRRFDRVNIVQERFEWKEQCWRMAEVGVHQISPCTEPRILTVKAKVEERRGDVTERTSQGKFSHQQVLAAKRLKQPCCAERCAPDNAVDCVSGRIPDIVQNGFHPPYGTNFRKRIGPPRDIKISKIISLCVHNECPLVRVIGQGASFCVDALYVGMCNDGGQVVLEGTHAASKEVGRVYIIVGDPRKIWSASTLKGLIEIGSDSDILVITEISDAIVLARVPLANTRRRIRRGIVDNYQLQLPQCLV